MAYGGISKWTPPQKSWKNPVSVEKEQADMGRDSRNPYHETKFSGANGDREMFIFPI